MLVLVSVAVCRLHPLHGEDALIACVLIGIAYKFTEHSCSSAMSKLFDAFRIFFAAHSHAAFPRPLNFHCICVWKASAMLIDVCVSGAWKKTHNTISLNPAKNVMRNQRKRTATEHKKKNTQFSYSHTRISRHKMSCTPWPMSMYASSISMCDFAILFCVRRGFFTVYRSFLVSFCANAYVHTNRALSVYCYRPRHTVILWSKKFLLCYCCVNLWSEYRRFVWRWFLFCLIPIKPSARSVCFLFKTHLRNRTEKTFIGHSNLVIAWFVSCRGLFFGFLFIFQNAYNIYRRKDFGGSQLPEEVAACESVNRKACTDRWCNRSTQHQVDTKQHRKSQDNTSTTADNNKTPARKTETHDARTTKV